MFYTPMKLSSGQIQTKFMKGYEKPFSVAGCERNSVLEESV